MDDTDPIWECGCGVKTKESQRREHLGGCIQFIRSWESAFHALTRSIYNERKLHQSPDNTDLKSHKSHKSKSHKSKLPLSLDQRIKVLETNIAHKMNKKVHRHKTKIILHPPFYLSHSY